MSLGSFLRDIGGGMKAVPRVIGSAFTQDKPIYGSEPTMDVGPTRMVEVTDPTLVQAMGLHPDTDGRYWTDATGAQPPGSTGPMRETVSLGGVLPPVVGSTKVARPWVKSLAARAPGMLEGFAAGASMPNVAGGGGTDIMRALSMGLAMPQAKAREQEMYDQKKAAAASAEVRATATETRAQTAEKRAVEAARVAKQAAAVAEQVNTAKQLETERRNRELADQVDVTNRRLTNTANETSMNTTAQRMETERHNLATEAMPKPTKLLTPEEEAQYKRLHPPAAAGGATLVDAPGMADPAASEILGQTGLSINAFRLLTGQASQLPRDQATRNKAALEAQKFAKAKGVDISTLPSQYTTYNKVLSFNLTRQSMATVQEQEIQGTIQNLKAVADDASLRRLRWTNVAKIWAGQEVNDPTAQQYAFHLEQLRSEIVAYNLIAQGQVNADGSLKQSDEGDLRRAEATIKKGIDSGSLQGLEDSVRNSTAKMSPVLQRSVESARKGVWNLFGVGKNYKGPAGSPPTAGGSNVVDLRKKYGY